MLRAAAILSSLATAVAAAAPGDPPARRLALTGATVYVSPSDAPVRDGVVLVEGDVIAAVGAAGALPLPDGVETIDCSGLTVTAGYVNCHVHLFERKWADAGSIPAGELAQQLEDMFTRYGFTSIFDLSSRWDNTRRLRERIDSGEVPGPRIRSTGEGLVPPGAVPSDQVLAMMGVMPTELPVVASAAEAEAAARRLLDEDVDGIKLFMSSPRGPALDEDVVAAAVATAHARGKPVFVHPNDARDVMVAARSGVDVIAHTTPSSGPWDVPLLREAVERRVALIPTLQLWKYQRRHDRVSVRTQLTDAAVDQLRAWIDAGGLVLFGTDVGAVEYDPTDEYLLMAEAGMSTAQILASLTTTPAERLDYSGLRGKVAPGAPADLVVLKGDPARDVRAFADVRYTLRAGRVIYRAPD